MKDEIKEILEDVKRHLDYVEATKQCSIRDNEMKAMYDYITDLQDTIQNKNECIIAYDEIIKNRDEEITNLQEAIETIKNTNKLLIQQKAQLQDDLDMLDNRIDKAIEYLKEDLRKNEYENRIDHHYIINILQGKSDE